MGHVFLPQACPSKPLSQTHTPCVRSQYPRFEHSAGACASSAPLALSDHAGPTGHSIRLQSAPVHPVLQLHCRAEVEPSVEDSHEPCPLQRFGEHGWATACRNRKLRRERAATPTVFIARTIMLTGASWSIFSGCLWTSILQQVEVGGESELEIEPRVVTPLFFTWALAKNNTGGAISFVVEPAHLF